MAFRFSLGAVLLVRRQREEAEERRLGVVTRELEQTKANLDRVRVELKSAAAERALGAPEVLQGVVLHARYARSVMLQHALVELEANVAQTTVRQTAQQQVYVAARRDRELLEEMEHRQKTLYTAEAQRREQRRNDDLFLAQHLRP